SDGKVQAVRVVSSSAGEGTTWEKVAKNAAGALSAKALALRGDAATRGATITVKVESKQIFPAGSSRQADVQPVCAEEVRADVARQGAARLVGGPRGPYENGAINPAKGFGDPDAEERKRRFCIPVGVAGKLDASNFGAHALTRVSSTYKVTVPGTLPLPADV